MVKLAPTKKQHATLLNTMHKFNEACNYIAELILLKVPIKLNFRSLYTMMFERSLVFLLSLPSKLPKLLRRIRETNPLSQPLNLRVLLYMIRGFLAGRA